MKNSVKLGVILVFGLVLFLGCIENTGLTVTKKDPLIVEKLIETQKTLEIQQEPEKASFLDKIKEELIPKGKPEYSDGVLHFGVQGNSLNKLVEYNNEIELTVEENERFEIIASQTFCEFCCGPVAINKCGCRHSAGYKGLVKYLITNFPEYSNEKIVEEQEKWKASFFQKGTIFKHLKEQKALGKVSEEEINKIEEMIGSC